MEKPERGEFELGKCWSCGRSIRCGPSSISWRICPGPFFHSGGSYDPLHLPPYLWDPRPQPTTQKLPTEKFKTRIEEENQKVQLALKRFGMQWPMANPPTMYVAFAPPPSSLSAAEPVAAAATEADVVADDAETLPANVFDSTVVTGVQTGVNIMGKRVQE